MDYIKQYKSFVYSHYLSEGLRITVGLTLPALLLSYANNLSLGITVSLGACCVIFVDNPGPIRDRLRAMVLCDLVIFVVALLTGLFNQSTFGLGLFLLIVCFCFSMTPVFGSRMGSLGVAAMFVMVLNVSGKTHGWHAAMNAFFVLCGGLWYTLLSLVLYSFRPFRLAQQALGDCLQATADYLFIRASFYRKDLDFQQNYQALLDQQIIVHQKQDLVRELLFKSRDIVKETTLTGRILVMIFLDTVDLFELVISYHPDYKALHGYFEETELLDQVRQVVEKTAGALDDVGLAVKSGQKSTQKWGLEKEIRNLQSKLNQVGAGSVTSTLHEGIDALTQVLEFMDDLNDRIQVLQRYTSYDQRIAKQKVQQLDLEQFVTEREPRFEWKLLRDNLSFESNIFRHAFRVSLATEAGYIVSKLLPLGHSYWILLTIIVILKPAYSLTKKRNYDRLLGTLAGAAIAIVLLYLIKDRNLIFACMVLFMIGAYSFMRSRYLVFVVLMTPYISLLFYLLNPHDFSVTVQDRILDTIIGSVIAFVANVLILPAWEHEHFDNYLISVLQANRRYFLSTASGFLGKRVDTGEFKLSRKEAFVALANLLDAFNRLLTEPRRKQKNLELLHPFVVSQHMITSHIATLSALADHGAKALVEVDFKPLITEIQWKLQLAQALLEGNAASDNEPAAVREDAKRFQNQMRLRLDRGKSISSDAEAARKIVSGYLKPIVDQFNFIDKVSGDVEKLCREFVRASKTAEAATTTEPLFSAHL